MIAEEKDIFLDPAIEYQTTKLLLKRSPCSLPVFLPQSLVGTNSWELASVDAVVTSPRFPVFNLVEGERYRFRVRSVNKHGVSDPSEPSKTISLGTPRGEIKSRGLYFTLYLTFCEGRSSAENTLLMQPAAHHVTHGLIFSYFLFPRPKFSMTMGRRCGSKPLLVFCFR